MFFSQLLRLLPSDASTKRVFIAIKTRIQAQVHKDRLPQIQQTWLPDALERHDVDIKLFADPNPAFKTSFSWLLPTPNCGSDLCCMDETMFQYYFKEHSTSNDNTSPFSPWFCSFDDDNYVIVENLVQTLQSYEKNNDTRLYLGRHSMRKRGMPWEPLNNTMVYFLTGGAGVCISRTLMEEGRALFSNFAHLCNSTRLPNDMAIGYIVNTKLGVQQRTDERFHSHLEGNLSEMPQRRHIQAGVFWVQQQMDQRSSNQGLSKCHSVVFRRRGPLVVPVSKSLSSPKSRPANDAATMSSVLTWLIFQIHSLYCMLFLCLL